MAGHCRFPHRRKRDGFSTSSRSTGTDAGLGAVRSEHLLAGRREPRPVRYWHPAARQGRDRDARRDSCRRENDSVGSRHTGRFAPGHTAQRSGQVGNHRAGGRHQVDAGIAGELAGPRRRDLVEHQHECEVSCGTLGGLGDDANVVSARWRQLLGCGGVLEVAELALECERGGRPRTDALRKPSSRMGRMWCSACCARPIRRWLHVTSTRKVDDLVKAPGADTGLSKSEVSRICAELDVEVAPFPGPVAG